MKKSILVLLTCTFLLIASGCGEKANETITNSDGSIPSQSETSATTCDHSFSEWTIESSATCQKEGAKLRVCQKCAFKETEILKALEHTIVIEKEKNATCVESGLTEGKHCSACNTVIEKQEPILAKGHSYDNDEDDKCNVCGFKRVLNCKHKNQTTIKGAPASCVEDGVTDGKVCNDCEQVIQKQQKISAKGHSEVVDKAVAPTCSKTGLTDGKHCSVCNYVIVAQKVVGLSNHTAVTEKAIAPTCTQSGLTEGKRCSVCNYVITAQKEVAAKGHTEVIDQAVLPTCTQTGLTEGKHCSVCNQVIISQKKIEKTSHNPVYAEPFIESLVCKHCNEVVSLKLDLALGSITITTSNGITSYTQNGNTLTFSGECAIKQSNNGVATQNTITIDSTTQKIYISGLNVSCESSPISISSSNISFAGKSP